MKKIIFAVICLALSSCATPYQPKDGFGHGYSDIQLGTDTFRVEFKGNSDTDSTDVSLYLLYRCAELTIEKGFDYFVFITQDAGSNTGTGVMLGTSIFLASSPGASALIKAYKGNKPNESPSAFDAKELLLYLDAEFAKIKSEREKRMREMDREMERMEKEG